MRIRYVYSSSFLCKNKISLVIDRVWLHLVLFRLTLSTRLVTPWEVLEALWRLNLGLGHHVVTPSLGLYSCILIVDSMCKYEVGNKFIRGGLFLSRNSTINYQARQQEIDFVLTPYYGSANLSFAAAQETLKLKYTKTTLQVERLDKKTSGLDPAAVRAATLGFPLLALADPQIPIVSKVDNRLVLDVEGVIANSDGSWVSWHWHHCTLIQIKLHRFWISDEYGPYIYKFSESGHLIQTIQPPKAIQPRDAKGNLNFTANTDPTTGRVGNQGKEANLQLKDKSWYSLIWPGFEGLTVDPSTGTVYAMLQSATVQDGGSDSTTSRFTRLLAYDVNNPILEPRLIGEYVVPLPVSSKGKTRASSEVHFVSPGIFFSLSRDANGRGSDDNSSSYKYVLALMPC